MPFIINSRSHYINLSLHLRTTFRYYTSAPATITKSRPRITFYRRELPISLISFTSDRGKQLFRESVTSGCAENYFPLVGNYTTQSEPAFCGLGSLAMVLNALEIDPGREWKGVWRWYSDDNLDCCATDVSEIKEKGVTFREFGCLAKCNGLSVIAKRIDFVSEKEFLRDLEMVCKSSDTHMVVSFCRKTLGQTGDGHFSPVGSYHPESQMALILDTARFKYPSYYTPARLLYESMKPTDKETGLPRGYFILKRDSTRKSRFYRPLSLCRLTKTLGVSNPKLANLFCKKLPEKIRLQKPERLVDVFSTIFEAIPAQYSAFIGVEDHSEVIVDLAAPEGESVEKLAEERDKYLIDLLMEVKATDLYSMVNEALQKVSPGSLPPSGSINNREVFREKRELNAALASIFILACPGEIFKTVPQPLIKELERVRRIAGQSELLQLEVERIGNQLSSLMNDYCQCSIKYDAYSKLPSVRLQQQQAAKG